MSKNSKINWNEFKEIENMEDIYKLLNILYKSNENFLYRGQSNSGEKEWELCSSLYRDLDSLKIESFLSFVEEKLKFIENKKGLKNDLNNYLSILSEMQHYGNPTALIDFTSNILHALWFACSEEKKRKCLNCKNNIKKEKERYFQLFLLPRKKNIEYKIENMKNTDIYSCPKNITRGLSQKSFFILHNKENMIKEYEIEEIKINKKLKDKILIFLESQNINAESIFPDLKGMYQSFFKYSWTSLFFQGLHLQRKGNHDESIEKYKKAIEINPKYEGSYNNLGISLEKKEEYYKAIEKFKKAIEINPNYAEAYYNWANTLAKQDNYSDAIKKYEKAIEINPNYAEVYSNLGVALNNQGNYDEAIKKYKKAIEINPNYAEAYSNWGNILVQQCNYNEAIENYKKAIENDLNNAFVYCNWGVALRKIDNYDEAIKKFKKAIEVNPNYANAYYNWGIILSEKEEYYKAIEKFKKAIEINPSDKEAYELLEKVKNELKHLEK